MEGSQRGRNWKEARRRRRSAINDSQAALLFTPSPLPPPLLLSPSVLRPLIGVSEPKWPKQRRPHLIQSHDMRTPTYFKQSDRRTSDLQTGMLGEWRRQLKKEPLIRSIYFAASPLQMPSRLYPFSRKD